MFRTAFPDPHVMFEEALADGDSVIHRRAWDTLNPARLGAIDALFVRITTHIKLIAIPSGHHGHRLALVRRAMALELPDEALGAYLLGRQPFVQRARDLVERETQPFERQNALQARQL